MKQPSEIAEEIIRHYNSLDDIHPGIADGLKDAIAAAIQARDEAHKHELETMRHLRAKAEPRLAALRAAERNTPVESYAAEVERLKAELSKLSRSVDASDSECAKLEAELESARAVMTTIADMTLHSKLGGAGPSVRIAQTCGSMARKWLERQGK